MESATARRLKLKAMRAAADGAAAGATARHEGSGTMLTNPLVASEGCPDGQLVQSSFQYRANSFGERFMKAPAMMGVNFSSPTLKNCKSNSASGLLGAGPPSPSQYSRSPYDRIASSSASPCQLASSSSSPGRPHGALPPPPFNPAALGGSAPFPQSSPSVAGGGGGGGAAASGWLSPAALPSSRSDGAQSGPSHFGGNSAPSPFGGNSVPSHFGGNSAPSNFGGNSAPSNFGGNSAPSHFGGNSAAQPFGGNSAAQPFGGNHPSRNFSRGNNGNLGRNNNFNSPSSAFGGNHPRAAPHGSNKSDTGSRLSAAMSTGGGGTGAAGSASFGRASSVSGGGSAGGGGGWRGGENVSFGYSPTSASDRDFNHTGRRLSRGPKALRTCGGMNYSRYVKKSMVEDPWAQLEASSPTNQKDSYGSPMLATPSKSYIEATPGSAESSVSFDSRAQKVIAQLPSPVQMRDLQGVASPSPLIKAGRDINEMQTSETLATCSLRFTSAVPEMVADGGGW